MPTWFPPVSDVIGNDCLNCYGVGETPLNYYVSFFGIKRGFWWLPWMGQPPSGWFQVTQLPLAPCTWELLLGPGNIIRYTSFGAQTVLLFDRVLALPIFSSTVGVACVRFHSNFYNTPFNNFFWGGYAFVFTPQEAQAIIESHTPVVDPDPLLAVHPVAGGDIVVSYIDRWGDTKFKMRVAPTL